MLAPQGATSRGFNKNAFLTNIAVQKLLQKEHAKVTPKVMSKSDV